MAVAKEGVRGERGTMGLSDWTCRAASWRTADPSTVSLPLHEFFCLDLLSSESSVGNVPATSAELGRKKGSVAVAWKGSPSWALDAKCLGHSVGSPGDERAVNLADEGREPAPRERKCPCFWLCTAWFWEKWNTACVPTPLWGGLLGKSRLLSLNISRCVFKKTEPWYG